VFAGEPFAPALSAAIVIDDGEAPVRHADTMDLWINIAKPEWSPCSNRVDMLILNDGEARQLTGLTQPHQGPAPRSRTSGPK